MLDRVHPTPSTETHGDDDYRVELRAPAAVLERIVDVAGTLVDECIVRFDADGLRLAAADPALVALVDVSLDADAFHAYRVSEPAAIGIDLDRLGECLGMAGADDEVHLRFDAETAVVGIELDDLAYAMAGLDPASVRDPPELDALEAPTTATVVLDRGPVARAIRAAELVSDHLALGVEADPPAFVAEADGDTDEMAVAVDGADLESVDPGAARSLFSITYVNGLYDALPADGSIRLALGSDAPLVCEFEIADGAGEVTYSIAPRIRGD